MLRRDYPTPPLSPVPAILIESFKAEIASDTDESRHSDDLEKQRIYSLFAGACQRATVCGGLQGHDAQAAAMLVAIKEFDTFLDGDMTIGGRDGLARKLDAEELAPLHFGRRVLTNLLEWHFKNGAGRLLPFAEWLGVVEKEA